MRPPARGVHGPHDLRWEPQGGLPLTLLAQMPLLRIDRTGCTSHIHSYFLYLFIFIQNIPTFDKSDSLIMFNEANLTECPRKWSSLKLLVLFSRALTGSHGELLQAEHVLSLVEKVSRKTDLDRSDQVDLESAAKNIISKLTDN